MRKHEGHKGSKGHRRPALCGAPCLWSPWWSPCFWSMLIVVVIALFGDPNAIAAAQNPEHPPASLTDLEAAVKREPGNPNAHVALGLAYWDRNDYPRALQAFERAVKVGPRSAEAHNWLGVALSEKADLPGAIAEFQKAVA